jgi:hypothetical protein
MLTVLMTGDKKAEFITALGIYVPQTDISVSC